MLSGLVAAEEGARGQLAAELHDTVAQSLISATALLDDPGRQQTMGAAGERVVHERFTERHHVAALLDEAQLGLAAIRRQLAR